MHFAARFRTLKWHICTDALIIQAMYELTGEGRANIHINLAKSEIKRLVFTCARSDKHWLTTFFIFGRDLSIRRAELPEIRAI